MASVKKSGWLRVWHFIGEFLHVQHLLELFGIWPLIVGSAGGVGVALLAKAEALPLAIQIVLCLATLLLVLAIGKSIKPTSAAHEMTAAAPRQQATAAGTRNQALSAGRDIIFNHPPTETIRKPAAARDRVSPNIRYAGYRDTDVYIDRRSNGGIKEPRNAQEHQNAQRAVVLRFENEPWSDGIGANTGVIAKAEYDSLPQNARISYAVWMDASIRSHYIEVGETHELILFIKSTAKDDTAKPLMILDDRRELNSYFSDPWSWFRMEELDAVRAVRVTLTDQRSMTQYIFYFDVAQSEDNFTINLRESRLPPQRVSPSVAPPLE